MIGKLKNDIPYYYYKDHLGSVRAVVNANNELVSAQDYDQWGYILEGRTFESDVSKFKFTSKERDQESFYDYFGARYYDARIGRWGQVDPEVTSNVSLSSYQYAKLNPLFYIDPDGKFEIPKEYKDTYSKLYKYVTNEIERVSKNEKTMKALNEASGLSKEEIMEDLKSGNGPSIGVLDLGYDNNGQKKIGHYDQETNSILLDVSIVNELENASGDDLTVYKQLMESLVLHEETHRGVAKTEIDTKGKEPGYEFEKKAYRGKVDTYRSAAVVLNNRNIENNNPKRYKLKQNGF